MCKLAVIVGALCIASFGFADTLIVLNKGEATASLIDVKTGKTRVKLPVGNGPHEVAVSLDGKLAIVCNYGDQVAGTTLTLLDIKNAKVVKTFGLDTHRRPHGVVWWKGNAVLVTSETSKALLVVDVSEGKVLKAIPTEQLSTHMVAISPDRKFAYTANIGSGTVSEIDLDKGVKTRDFTAGQGSEGIEVTPDGTQVWTTNTRGASVSVLNSKTGAKLADMASGQMPIRVRFTQDGQTAIVSAAGSNEIYLYDAKSFKQTGKIDLVKEKLAVPTGAEAPQPVGILMSPSGDLAFIALCGSNRVAVFDMKKRKVLWLIETGVVPDGLGYSSY